MVDEAKFRNWLILEKGLSVIKAIQITEESQLPFRSDECKKLELEYEIEQKTMNDDVITVKIPKIIKEELIKISKENNMKVSQIIRSAILDFIESYKKFERRLLNEERSREEINRQGIIQKNSSKHKKD